MSQQKQAAAQAAAQQRAQAQQPVQQAAPAQQQAQAPANGYAQGYGPVNGNVVMFPGMQQAPRPTPTWNMWCFSAAGTNART